MSYRNSTHPTATRAKTTQNTTAVAASILTVALRLPIAPPNMLDRRQY